MTKHYAEKAKNCLLRGINHTSVASAIEDGVRTNEQWLRLLELFRKKFWSTHNKKARASVKLRHPVKKAKISDEPNVISSHLEDRAKAWPDLGRDKPMSERIKIQSHAAYWLYLDYLEEASNIDFVRWLSSVSSVSYGTCRRRLVVGIALNAENITTDYQNRNQSGVLAEVRERRIRPQAHVDWSEESEAEE